MAVFCYNENECKFPDVWLIHAQEQPVRAEILKSDSTQLGHYMSNVPDGNKEI